MATWVTHLMVADRVLEKGSWLDWHGFCVGNIAPDCNVENEDWTEYTPHRAVTHTISIIFPPEPLSVRSALWAISRKGKSADIPGSGCPGKSMRAL